MTDELLSKIKAIPLLSDTFYKIKKIYEDDNGCIDEMIDVVKKDPMLVANILKMVNSPLYSLKKEVQSVSQAVSLLGMKEVYAICATVSIRKLLNVDMEPYEVDPHRFAILSNIQGDFIRDWIGKRDKQKAQLLFLPALLQDIGKVIVADIVMRNNETFQFRSEIDMAISISQVEKIFVGATSAEITAKLFEHWGLGEFLINTIRYSDYFSEAPEKYKEYSMYLKVVKSAVNIRHPLSERSITIATNILTKEGVDTKDFVNVSKEMEKKYKGFI